MQAVARLNLIPLARRRGLPRLHKLGPERAPTRVGNVNWYLSAKFRQEMNTHDDCVGAFCVAGNMKTLEQGQDRPHIGLGQKDEGWEYCSLNRHGAGWTT